MSLSIGQSRLADALKQFRLRWQQAREGWDDAAAEQFQEEFVSPLEGHVSTATAAIGRLADALDEARRACDDSERW